jgi:hypothetical protein
VVVNFTGTCGELACAAAWFTGVNQTTPEGTVNTDYSASSRTAATPDPVVVVGTDLAVYSCAFNASFTLTSADTTIRINEFEPGFSGTAISTATTTTTPQTGTLTIDGSNIIQGVGFALKP